MDSKSTARTDDASKDVRTAEQVARFLGVPVSPLYRWCCFSEGRPAYRVGRHLRYDPVRMQRWLDEKGRVRVELAGQLAGKGHDDVVFLSPQGSVLRVQNFRRRCSDRSHPSRSSQTPTGARNAPMWSLTWADACPRQDSNLRHTV
jgi:hypothetical protein